MLKVEHIYKSYDDIMAVKDLSFEVKEGEIFGLLGVNGAGKSTTFRMIVGLLEKDQGNITLDQKKIDYSITDKIGFLPEERSLLIKLTVKEQLTYYATLKGMKKEDISKKIDYWLERLHMMEFKNKKLKEISKGNQQKVQFISSIIHEPRLLILDEPFTSLDPFNVHLLIDILKELSKEGCLIIFSSHRMEQVEMFCDKLLILVDGKNVLEGTLSDVKNNYRKRKIHVEGDISEDDFSNIPGVLDVSKKENEILLIVKDETVSSKVFDSLRNKKNITKFYVEEVSLNDIFVSIVGDVYEE
ncbi:MAG: ATP-binding cassette domain-containing protein [Bacilli bacterium]|nr:ATP-binding cassette domain-containing protein [Bacilli bacterium]